MSYFQQNIKLPKNSFDLLTHRLLPPVTDRLLIIYGIFYMADVNDFLLVNKIMLISPDIYFKTVFEWLSLA